MSSLEDALIFHFGSGSREPPKRFELIVGEVSWETLAACGAGWERVIKDLSDVPVNQTFNYGAVQAANGFIIGSDAPCVRWASDITTRELHPPSNV